MSLENFKWSAILVPVPTSPSWIVDTALAHGRACKVAGACAGHHGLPLLEPRHAEAAVSAALWVSDRGTDMITPINERDRERDRERVSGRKRGRKRNRQRQRVE